jgi:hypothetical protein
VVMQSAIAASIADGNGPAKDLHYLENLLGSHPAARSPAVGHRGTDAPGGAGDNVFRHESSVPD